MARLFLCSGNAHKVQEISAVLGPCVQVVTPRILGVALDVEETEDTFDGNALLKARAGFKLTGLPTLADDSGLCVDALGGLPGVRSARFAMDHGAGSGDAANNTLLLEKLKDVPDSARGAHFVCVLALVHGGGEALFHGKLPGRIARSPAGQHGFGYDPLMILEGGRSLAELTEDEKNAISHRARALAVAREAIVKVAG